MGTFAKVYTQKSLRYRRHAFYVNAIFLFGIVGFFIFMAGQNVYDEKLRDNASNELVSATATSTQHDCAKSGCWYDSYGYYTIDGKKEQNVEVADHDNYAFLGTLSVLVDPNVPRFAMNPYYDPYPRQAETFVAFAVGTLALNILGIVMYRKMVRKNKVSLDAIK